MQLPRQQIVKALLCFICTIPFFVRAQYCAPVISDSGIFIQRLDFVTSGGIESGRIYQTTNGLYTQTLDTAAGLIRRYFGGGFHYNLVNLSAEVRPFGFDVYADWNSDGDFNDLYELQFSKIDSLTAGASTTTSTNIFPPLNVPPGDIRIRLALRDSSDATACGNYAGEVEDYLLTLPVNYAPVLNTTATTYINSMLVTDTNSNGISLSEFIQSCKPAGTLIADADDRGVGYYNVVPRGIAIYDQSASNGTWQYKIENGAWTDFGVLDSANALLLLADAAFRPYEHGARIRFVPTAAGMPTFTYKAWDGTMGLSGGYGNISSTGGSTAFSSGNLVGTLTVLASTGFGNKIYLSTINNVIYTAAFNRSAGVISNAEPLLKNADAYYASDITLDTTTGKIYWVSGPGNDKIASANADSTGANLSLITGLTYATGLATGNGKLYYWNWAADFSSADLYQANPDGTGILKISGGIGQFNGTGVADTKDIEFYNNKLYFQYSDGENYHIASVNADGTGFSSLYLTINPLAGLAVANDTIYWTESDGTINKIATSGGSSILLISETGRNLTDLLIDPSTSELYFIEGDPDNPNYSLLRRLSPGGGVVTMLTLSGIVTSITLDNTLTVLPVSLTKFAGRYMAQNRASILQWSTASEQQAAYFIVERSIDGKKFIQVNSVAARGGLSLISNYQFTDDVSSLTTGILYYRLKQVDKDGNFKYSGVVVLNLNMDQATVRLLPNPGRDLYTIQLASIPPEPVTIRVYNGNGRFVTNAIITSEQYSLNLSSQPPGIYYVHLYYRNGEQKQLTLVKN